MVPGGITGIFICNSYKVNVAIWLENVILYISLQSKPEVTYKFWSLFALQLYGCSFNLSLCLISTCRSSCERSKVPWQAPEQIWQFFEACCHNPNKFTQPEAWCAHPNKFWTFCHTPDAIRTKMEFFWKFCPNLKARFSRFRTRPPDLYLGVLQTLYGGWKKTFVNKCATAAPISSLLYSMLIWHTFYLI
jgi:hypothetical protein